MTIRPEPASFTAAPAAVAFTAADMTVLPDLLGLAYFSGQAAARPPAPRESALDQMFAYFG